LHLFSEKLLVAVSALAMAAGVSFAADPSPVDAEIQSDLPQLRPLPTEVTGGKVFASSYETWLGRDEKSGPHGHGGGDHFANFIDGVRSRKKEDLNAPIEEGHNSSALIHLVNASYRLGRTLHFDSESEQVIGAMKPMLFCGTQRGDIDRRSLYRRKFRRRTYDQRDLSR
jgi:hypothetical protein